jgi:hypothetical protein
MNKKNTCANCKHFEKITHPKIGWLERVKHIKENHPNLSHEQQIVLANDNKSWEQQDSGLGFCKSNDHLLEIESRIPDYISCKYFKTAHP